MTRPEENEAGGEGKPTLSPEQAQLMWTELIQLNKQSHIEQQRRGEDLVRSVQGLPPLDRVEAWLRYVANHERRCYSSQEAIVYFVSRGYDCTEIVRDLVRAWKLDEKRSIKACAQEIVVWKADTGQPGEVAREGLVYEETSDIVNTSPFILFDFWSFSDSQELSMDATMLRTVEWCSIGGFYEWWLRLAKTQYEMAVQGGIDPIPASYYLFNMCRSDYAIELMPKALNRMLEAIELPDHRQTRPWRRWRWTSPPRSVDHFSYAASIVFANRRIRSPQSNDTLVAQASEALLRHQGTKGCWRCWMDDDEPSIETTAMAIHALAMERPRGWKVAVSAAEDWLWSVQDKSGCWIDFDCPDSVYLTVLVLDALELAKGGTTVTFRLPAPMPESRETERRSMSKTKALFLAANPANTRTLRLDEQIRLITQKIRAADYRESLELVSAWAVRPDDLLQCLNEHRPHIVHFSGHGSQTGEILLVGDDGQAKPISTEAIRALFMTLRDNIKVVILDACYSESQAEAITEVIDCAIGMGDAVSEDAASTFTASFYRAVGFGRSVQQAFDQGIAALLLEGIPEENIPKLLTRPGVDPSCVFLYLLNNWG